MKAALARFLKKASSGSPIAPTPHLDSILRRDMRIYLCGATLTVREAISRPNPNLEERMRRRQLFGGSRH